MFLTPRAFALAALWVLLFALAYFYAPLLPVVQLMVLLFGLVLVADFALLVLAVRLSGARKVAARLCNGESNAVALEARSATRFPLWLRWADEAPETLRLSPISPRVQRLSAGQHVAAAYQLFPTDRGQYHFGQLWAFVRTDLGLWERRLALAPSERVEVYPRYTRLKERHQQIRMLLAHPQGQRLRRGVSHRTEFDEIRTYVKGDDYRAINWKATARHAQLMVNHYAEERAQRIISLLDCGRAMQRRFAGLSLLDHAVNATLQLSFSAMQSADHCGLATLGHSTPRYLPPHRGSSQMQRIVEQLYALDTVYAESDFSQIAPLLEQQSTPRSLLVLYTDFYTHDALLRQLLPLHRLAQRHALLVVFFADAELSEAVQPLSEADLRRAQPEQLVTHGLASELYLQKWRIVESLNRMGIHTLLTPPEQLTTQVVHKYFELKARAAW